MLSRSVFVSCLAIGIVLVVGLIAPTPSHGDPKPSMPEDIRAAVTSTPTPTITAKPTPTATPTPPPPPPCSYYQVTSVKVKGHDLPPQLYTISQHNNCLETRIKNAIKACAGEGDNLDSCTSCTVLGWGFDGPNDCANDKDPIGTVCFDSKCKVRSCSSFIGDEMCASATTYWVFTPISLLWDGQTELKRQGPAVAFPLNPAEKGKSYMWYASAKAPLLVYDPGHSGQITSAAQLFGNWTFGGKRTASLQGDSESSDARVVRGGPWRDGFEALASLDLDNDNRVSGNEVEALALWFDGNQNGVSEAGEVVTLAAAGVDVLYYEPDSRGAAGSIYAHRGYERVIDGKRITGTSVDWYAEKSDSPTALLFQVLTAQASAEQTPAAAPKEKAKPESSQAVGEPNLSGVWHWTSDDPALPASGAEGFLSFQDRGGEISGHTLTELELRPGLGISSSVHLLAFKGQKNIDPQSTAQTALFTTLLRDGSILNNTAELSRDGKTLQGRTEAVLQLETGVQSVSYTWVAKRVEIR